MTPSPPKSPPSLCILPVLVALAAPLPALADSAVPTASPAAPSRNGQPVTPRDATDEAATAEPREDDAKGADRAKATTQEKGNDDAKDEPIEEANAEPGSEDTEEKPLNIAAIGSVATGATGLLTTLAVVVVAILQVPNPLLYPFHQSDLADAEARYRETRDYEQFRRAQDARAGISAIESGFADQAGVLLTSVAALLPAAVTLAVGVTQLVVEE